MNQTPSAKQAIVILAMVLIALIAIHRVPALRALVYGTV